MLLTVRAAAPRAMLSDAYSCKSLPVLPSAKWRSVTMLTVRHLQKLHHVSAGELHLGKLVPEVFCCSNHQFSSIYLQHKHWMLLSEQVFKS